MAADFTSWISKHVLYISYQTILYPHQFLITFQSTNATLLLNSLTFKAIIAIDNLHFPFGDVDSKSSSSSTHYQLYIVTAISANR